MVPPLHPPIVRNVIYPIYRGFRGDALLPMLERFERNQWLAAEELEDLQWRMLYDLLVKAVTYVPYYSELFKARGVVPDDISNTDDFRRIPILTKDSIREAGERIITTDPTRKGFPLKMGGGTGEALCLYGDVASGPARRANNLRCYRWADVDVGDRQAFLWEHPPVRPFRRRLLESLKNYFNNVIYLSTLAMSEDSMRRYAKRLKKYGPAIIVGYPSSLQLFCRFCKREGLGGIAPAAVVTSGETLSLEQRETIERFFGCAVFDRYGGVEFNNVAQECREHNGLHIFSDLVYVEVLSTENEPVKPGEVGELVITDLRNHYMPFIRYRTGDLAVQSDRKCPCGRGLPLLERIEGRSFGPVDDIPPGPSRKSRAIESGTEDRLVVKSKIHKARITRERPEEMDCLVVDEKLLELTNISDGEKVLIVDNTNGARVETFAVKGERESGEITACGAASRHIHAGDEVSIMAFAWSDGSGKSFENILVDERNRFVRYLTEIEGEII
ncbi:MAG: aspartate 1-decarboxylase [Candidatus Krumholzibacteria bacterium]|nr:aspartate 1-decarboxylase [Candidatus Krumholzibacteria bacterium]